MHLLPNDDLPRRAYGITTLKVKVGRRPARLDTDVVRALRVGLGDDVELYVDANRGWSASESARAMQEMSDLGLTFAEELCPADDVLGRRWLVQQLDVPFIADESVATPADVTREVLAGSANAISLQRSGRWAHLWRIVGEYANVSIFDVDSNETLHELLSGLPLFPYMDIYVTPLAPHPSAIS
ncbi:hypothetical protein E2C04_07535 [Nocardioides daphniae]|uniref:Mandelate racemase/muconate lactonizing enzyme C-terminal domain-containing protein n=1 Tax=Nocardioides daphniae TaxID=402297 RepID=A0A4P7UH98_9ACTN|nr:hypothetical protein E2C04_07535 [Nocardioides daphniae]